MQDHGKKNAYSNSRLQRNPFLCPVSFFCATAASDETLTDYPDATDEKRITELYNRKMSDLQIALAMKCSKQSIYLWRKKRGLKSNFNPKEEKEEPKDEQGPGNQAEV